MTATAVYTRDLTLPRALVATCALAVALAGVGAPAGASQGRSVIAWAEWTAHTAPPGGTVTIEGQCFVEGLGIPDDWFVHVFRLADHHDDGPYDFFVRHPIEDREQGRWSGSFQVPADAPIDVRYRITVQCPASDVSLAVAEADFAVVAITDRISIVPDTTTPRAGSSAAVKGSCWVDGWPVQAARVELTERVQNMDAEPTKVLASVELPVDANADFDGELPIPPDIDVDEHHAIRSSCLSSDRTIPADFEHIDVVAPPPPTTTTTSIASTTTTSSPPSTSTSSTQPESASTALAATSTTTAVGRSTVPIPVNPPSSISDESSAAADASGGPSGSSPVALILIGALLAAIASGVTFTVQRRRR